MSRVPDTSFIYRGLHCMTSHNAAGCRTGYVALPPNHPYITRDYEWDAEIGSNVHGGITWLDHDPLDYDVYDRIWVGFDCAHAGDAPDPELNGEFDIPFGENVRTLSFVIDQTQLLADEVADLIKEVITNE